MLARNDRSRLSKVIDFILIESPVCDFLLMFRVVTYVLSCTVSAIQRVKAQTCDQFLYLSLICRPPMNAASGSSRWNLPQRNYSHWAILLWKLHDRILGGNFDRAYCAGEWRTDGRTDGQLPKSPKFFAFFAPKIPLPPICGFPRARYADALWKYILLLKAEICQNLCVHLPLSMQFHILWGIRFEMKCHAH